MSRNSRRALAALGFVFFMAFVACATPRRPEGYVEPTNTPLPPTSTPVPTANPWSYEGMSPVEGVKDQILVSLRNYDIPAGEGAYEFSRLVKDDLDLLTLTDGNMEQLKMGHQTIDFIIHRGDGLTIEGGGTLDWSLVNGGLWPSVVLTYMGYIPAH